jgi:uncharacterized membrane protein YdjX (TVP38/TMEM64 family)
MKWMISIAVSLFLFFTLGYLLAEQAGWTDDEWMSEQIRALQERSGGLWWAGLAVASLLTLDLFLPVPSSILMILSGAILGLHLGWLVALVGAMGSALLGFGLCRRWGKPVFDRVAGPVDTDRITRFFERHGLWAILLSRSVPMLTEIVSCLAGLSAMRFRLFFLVSLAGTWPLCVVYAWAGHRALDQSAVGWAVVLAFVLPAIGLLVYQWTLRGRSR